MGIIITEWAFQSYLDLRYKQNVFSDQDYWQMLRPDIELLKQPTHPKFQNDKFWSFATDKAGQVITGGYKMKWHKVGPGRVQLRLAVLCGVETLLCQAYVKKNDATDKKEMAKFKRYINLISQGRYVIRGRI